MVVREAELAVRDRRRARSGPSPRIGWGVTKNVLTHLQGQSWDLEDQLQKPVPPLKLRGVFNLLNTVAGKTSCDLNFQTLNALKSLLTFSHHTSTSTSLNKLLASLVVVNVVSWTTYARSIAPTHHTTALSASLLPPRNLQQKFPSSRLPLPRAPTKLLILFKHISSVQLSNIFSPASASLVFSRLSLLLETRHNYPHAQQT